MKGSKHRENAASARSDDSDLALHIVLLFKSAVNGPRSARYCTRSWVRSSRYSASRAAHPRSPAGGPNRPEAVHRAWAAVGVVPTRLSLVVADALRESDLQSAVA